MKTTIALVLLVAAIFVYPMVKEGADGQCDALEKIAIRQAPERGAAATLLQGLSLGKMADLYVRTQYPDLPPGIVCTFFYWKATANPDGLQEELLRRAR